MTLTLRWGIEGPEQGLLFDALVKDKSTVVSGNVGHSVLLDLPADFSSPDREPDPEQSEV